jgi:superfamily II DNA/RNA helicase
MASWVTDALPQDTLDSARLLAARKLVFGALGVANGTGEDDGKLLFAAETFELAALDLLESGASPVEVTQTSSEAFSLRRAQDLRIEGIESGLHLLRLGALGVLGDRGPDVVRLFREVSWPSLPLSSDDWGQRTLATIIDAWLRLFRKDGWNDLQEVQRRILALRESQSQLEGSYLSNLEEINQLGTARNAAWQLVTLYHLAKSAELLSLYLSQGNTGEGFDIREQLQAQFDAALIACSRAELVHWDSLARLLSYAAQRLVDNSIWTATRAVNSTVNSFVEQLVSHSAKRPIFELLPPQRQALREGGIRGGERAVVVNLPTSSGKTFLAEFRILQALNQFEAQKGWVAYLAPTRALVNQVCARLRRDFSPLGIGVERVSPALEIDGLEANLLKDKADDTLFRVLVTTPEKLDLLIRGGWEAEIGRPLTLVVVDEAHNIADGERGIRLELLLATVNRECKNAQFLLLTPFIRNAAEVAAWLSPESYGTVELEVEWHPNDRIVGLITPQPAAHPREFKIEFETIHTSRSTITVPDHFTLAAGKPLDLTWSKVRSNASCVAAVAATVLRRSGPIIVLAGRPDWAWGLAQRLCQGQGRPSSTEVALVQNYLALEFGADFKLIELLSHAVGVHHAGLSDEAKGLMEWLFEGGHINVLVATTTIAQGVNFPVSGVIVAQHQQYNGAGMIPMSIADFWNLAGRAGRADQTTPGVVGLVATDPAKADALRAYVNEQVVAINSTLIAMVQEVLSAGRELELHTLFNRPEWSAFLQYLAHTYRQVNDPERFGAQIDRILRGTFGFQKLRDYSRPLAQRLLEGAQAYGSRLANKPLQLVDSTGFSWESVSLTLRRLSEARISDEVWDPDALYSPRSTTLKRLMGILLEVPELRDHLTAATGGRGPNGDLLASMLIDWVGGASLRDMAQEYFSTDRRGRSVDPTNALTECCKNLFGRLTQTSSWGLAALQSMTMGEHSAKLDEATRIAVRNLPSRALYGVNTDNAIALRVLGIPRSAAQPLANTLRDELRTTSLPRLRQTLADSKVDLWRQALGDSGECYRRVWQLLELPR